MIDISTENTVIVNGKEMKVVNTTPQFTDTSKKETNKKRIERQLYDIFSKYE